jgi:hypothetical protein
MPTIKVSVNGKVRLNESYSRDRAAEIANGLLQHWPQLSAQGKVLITCEDGPITQLLMWNSAKGETNNDGNNAA